MGKRGRPRIEDANKNRMVYARLNPAEMDVLDKLCRKYFVSRSGLLRKAMYELADRDGIDIDLVLAGKGI